MLTKEQIAQSKWYRQSGAAIPFIGGLVHMGVCRMYVRSGFRMPVVGVIIKTPAGFSFFNYLDYQATEKETDKILKKISDDQGFFMDLRVDLESHIAKSEEIGKKMAAIDVDAPEFMRLYADFMDCTIRCWGDSLFMDDLDPFEEKVLDFIFGESRPALKPKDLTVLTAPDGLSYVQQEQKDMLEIYRKAKSAGLTAETEEMLKTHAEKYHWLKNDFENVQYLGLDIYRKNLEDMLKNPTLAQGIETNLVRFEELQVQKTDLMGSLKMDPKAVKRLKFFNWMTGFRDDRKRCAQLTNYYLYRAAEKVAQAKGLGMNWLRYALPEELPSIMEGDKRVMAAIEKRQGIGAMFVTDGNDNLTVTSGPEILEFYALLESGVGSSEIRGSAASLGKAIGSVKVILSQSDFAKFNKGDVLVASMTRPEYVPLIKIASAIITDEGGITCHAAIVSRELGVPCIIGTQVATRLLKDGDLVDVNANHGLITIITQHVTNNM